MEQDPFPHILLDVREASDKPLPDGLETAVKIAGDDSIEASPCPHPPQFIVRTHQGATETLTCLWTPGACAAKDIEAALTSRTGNWKSVTSVPHPSVETALVILADTEGSCAEASMAAAACGYQRYPTHCTHSP